MSEEMTPVQALQRTLAGEHAASYVYATLAAQVSQSSDPQLFSALDDARTEHRAQRDRLTARISRAGASPVAAEVAYRLPNAADSLAQVRAAARITEQRVVDLYGQLVEYTSGDDRRFAVDGLRTAALRCLVLGARPSDLPGFNPG